MLTIITKQSSEDPFSYETLYDNRIVDSYNQLHMVSALIRYKTLNDEKNGIIPESTYDDLYILHGEERCGHDYYIAFYHPLLDSYVEEMCEKRYGEKGFVFDDQTPMLRFTKENFEHILATWNNIKDNMPAYIILTESDDNWIDIWPKESLTNNEKKLIQKYKTDLNLH